MDAKNMKTALTIAGSIPAEGVKDSGRHQTMITNGVYAMSAMLALTAQNTTELGMDNTGVSGRTA